MDADTGKKELISSPEKEQIKLNILIVDDERVIRTMLKDYIMESTVAPQVGLVEMVANGQEALDAIESNKGRFNVVITDGNMPRMNGLSLAKKIKESGQNIAVVFVSGGIDEVDIYNPEKQESVKKEYGIVTILPKPFSPSQVAGLMQKIRVDVTVRNTETQAPNPQ